MRAARWFPLAVGALVFLMLTALDALHLGESSVWRAGIVGALSGGFVYGIGPKLFGGSPH